MSLNKYVYNFLDYALSWHSTTKIERESIKITFEAPRQKLVTQLCFFMEKYTSIAFLTTNLNNDELRYTAHFKSLEQFYYMIRFYNQTWHVAHERL